MTGTICSRSGPCTRRIRDVEALADDDSRLVRLAGLRGADDDAVRVFLEEECWILAHHGFGPGGTQSTDGLLSALVKAAECAVLESLERALAAPED